MQKNAKKFLLGLSNKRYLGINLLFKIYNINLDKQWEMNYYFSCSFCKNMVL